MTDNLYNITITYDNNNFIFNGSDESGILNTAKYTLYFKTNSLINFTLDFSNIDYDLSFIITTFNNETIINEGKDGGILELSSNSYIFYKFGPTVQSISGIIEIFSSSIANKEELINILNLKRNIVSNENVISDLQIFNTDKRRFLGNFNYIISDQSKLVTDSSGIVDDLIIQSVNSDINLVTDNSRQIHLWSGETIIEEDLIIKGNLRMHYNKADFRNSDVCFNTVNIESKSGLTIQNEEVPTKNYLDSSFTLLTDFNDLSYNVSLIELRGYNDASFNNVNISGNTIMHGNLYIDNDVSIISDLNINGILNISGIDVYDRFTKLDISINSINNINNIDLKQGLDASFTHVDVSGILNVSGIDVYDKFTKLDISINSINNINNIDLKQGLDASFTYVDISGNLKVDTINNYKSNQGITIENNLLKNGVIKSNQIGIGLNNDPSEILDISGNIKLNGILYGTNNLIIDPYGHGDDSGKVIIKGGLEVLGTTTTINSSVVDISDKKIVLASKSINKIQSDGAGIEISGANVSFLYNYNSNNDYFESNIDISATKFFGDGTNITGVIHDLNIYDDVSFGNVDISGILNVNGNILSVGNLEVQGDVSLNSNVDISGNIYIKNNLILSNNNNLGNSDISFTINNGDASLNIDVKNLTYLTKNIDFSNSSDDIIVKSLITNNFSNNTQITIYITNIGSSLLEFNGYNFGGINNCKINFPNNITLLQNESALINITCISNTNFLTASVFK